MTAMVQSISLAWEPGRSPSSFKVQCKIYFWSPALTPSVHLGSL